MDYPPVGFTREDLKAACAFAQGAAAHTYNRRGVNRQEQERDIKVGKLGEIAFAKYLAENGKAVKGTDDMFTIWHSTHMVDKLDFETREGKSIDVKTASKNYQKRILVPVDQFQKLPKDYYVGVRIAEDERDAFIKGYTTREEIQAAGKFEGAWSYPAYGKLFSELTPIDCLLVMMPDAQK